MNEFIDSLVNQLDSLPVIVAYTFFYLSGVLQMIFPPYPGDEIFIFGGYLGSQGKAGGFFPIFISYFLGILSISFFFFLLSHRNKDLIYKNRIVGSVINEDVKEKSRKNFKKHGWLMFFMGRFIPGLSLVTVIMGGVIGFNKSVALSLIAFSSFVHEAVFFFIGCVIGSNKLYINKFISIYNIFFIGILVLMVFLFVFKKFLKKEKRN